MTAYAEWTLLKADRWIMACPVLAVPLLIFGKAFADFLQTPL